MVSPSVFGLLSLHASPMFFWIFGQSCVQSVPSSVCPLQFSSIPLQAIYWQARRAKADCHIVLKEFDKAATELKWVTNRKFTPDNPNYAYRKQSFFKYGKTLLEIEEYAESLKAFNRAIEIEKELEEKKLQLFLKQKRLDAAAAKQEAAETRSLVQDVKASGSNPPVVNLLTNYQGDYASQ